MSAQEWAGQPQAEPESATYDPRKYALVEREPSDETIQSLMTKVEVHGDLASDQFGRWSCKCGAYMAERKPEAVARHERHLCWHVQHALGWAVNQVLGGPSDEWLRVRAAQVSDTEGGE